jgi:hypothetical protein
MFKLMLCMRIGITALKKLGNAKLSEIEERKVGVGGGEEAICM